MVGYTLCSSNVLLNYLLPARTQDSCCSAVFVAEDQKSAQRLGELEWSQTMFLNILDRDISLIQ